MTILFSCIFTKMREFSGTSIKDTWTKPEGVRIKGGKWGWLMCGGGKMETIVLEQQLNVKKF